MIDKLVSLLTDKSGEYVNLSDKQAADLANLKRGSNVVVESRYTIISLANELGPTIASALTDAMSSSSIGLVKHALKILEGGGTIDIGNDVTRGLLDSLVPTHTASIKALAQIKKSDAEVYGINKQVMPGTVQMARMQIAKE